MATPPIAQSASGCVEIGQAPGAGGPERLGVALKRVTGDVETQRLFLERQRFGLRPRAHGRERVHIVLPVRWAVGHTEELRLALLEVLLMTAAVVEDPVEPGE